MTTLQAATKLLKTGKIVIPTGPDSSVTIQISPAPQTVKLTRKDSATSVVATVSAADSVEKQNTNTNTK